MSLAALGSPPLASPPLDSSPMASAASEKEEKKVGGRSKHKSADARFRERERDRLTPEKRLQLIREFHAREDARPPELKKKTQDWIDYAKGIRPRPTEGLGRVPLSPTETALPVVPMLPPKRVSHVKEYPIELLWHTQGTPLPVWKSAKEHSERDTTVPERGGWTEWK